MKIVRIFFVCFFATIMMCLLWIGWNYMHVMQLCNIIAAGNKIDSSIVNVASLPTWMANLPIIDQCLEAKIPLVEACRYRNEYAVSVLLEGGADPDYHIPRRFTALEAAIMNSPVGPADDRSYEIVKLLIRAGADVNLHSGNRELITHELASQIDKEDTGSIRENILLYLLENGATPDNKLLCYCIYGGDIDLVRKLIVAYEYDINEAFDGSFFLHKAVIHPMVDGDMVEALLSYGANPLLKNAQGKNAIDLAEERGDNDILNLLLQLH